MTAESGSPEIPDEKQGIESGSPETVSVIISEHQAAAEIEREFRRSYPVLWWSALVGPFLVGIGVVVAVYLTQGLPALQNILVAIAGTFFMFGRFVILLGGDKLEFMNFTFEMSSEALFLMVTTMDVLVAIFVAFHMGILFKAPLFGPKLAEMVSDGRFILKHQPWIRNVAFGGLVLFVIFPTSTTGSIGGSIFGRLLGMNRFRVVIAILAGSLVGNAMMYGLSHWLQDVLPKDSIWLKVGAVLVMISVLVVVERYYRHLKKKFMAVEAEASS